MAYILLSSACQDQASTRSFNEFKSKAELAQTIVNHFEDYLETIGQMNDDSPNLEYSSDDMFDFVDKFYGELVCLEKQDDHTDLWIPYSTCWIKEAVYLYLRSQCPEPEIKPLDADIMDIDERSEIVQNI